MDEDETVNIPVTEMLRDDLYCGNLALDVRMYDALIKKEYVLMLDVRDSKIHSVSLVTPNMAEGFSPSPRMSTRHVNAIADIGMTRGVK